jgi:uncharacterized protein (TIGR00369 family)
MSEPKIFDLYDSQTGMEFLQAVMADGHRSPMADIFGFDLVEVADGTATVTAIPAEKFYNPMRRVHGGFAAALIDSALGCAVMTKLGKGIAYGTIELKVNFVRKIDVNTGTLSCRATVLHAGRTMFTAEARVVDQHGKLYAHGSGTFLIYPNKG